MIWIYDPIGNNGKTKFVKTMAFKHDCLSLGYGNAGDILNLVSKFQNKRMYIWNLTRTKPAQISALDLYTAMESVKDGLFNNTKYETAQVLMNPPHIVVMANHVPNRKNVTIDRWEIYTLTKGESKESNGLELYTY